MFSNIATWMNRVIHLFLWHLPDGATDYKVKHSSKLQPSIRLHAPSYSPYGEEGYKIHTM